MAFKSGGTCTAPFTNAIGGCSPQLIMTEGNLANGAPSSRRLKWIGRAYELDGSDGVGGGISLIDDLTRDKNLRAAFADATGNSIFEPLADGIINGAFIDNDDSLYVTGALRASLCMDGGTWPYACTPPPGLP